MLINIKLYTELNESKASIARPGSEPCESGRRKRRKNGVYRSNGEGVGGSLRVFVKYMAIVHLSSVLDRCRRLANGKLERKRIEGGVSKLESA